jgi:hypothetical protein
VLVIAAEIFRFMSRKRQPKWPIADLVGTLHSQTALAH